jgi:hypothetical protein
LNLPYGDRSVHVRIWQFTYEAYMELMFSYLPGPARIHWLRWILRRRNRLSQLAFSSLLAFGEGLNISFSGTQKISRVHAHVFAGLANAQQHQAYIPQVEEAK